ncbi:GatB/YqeY domain-containing protein [Cyclobacterium qasimii]|uniref:Transamidase GatB domain protein n=2 Tax=Cyclobacterium qasimii TaxID=1350429 RepID=S7V9R9_9BACT|nr:GatB/YqeY domain-containing protein [Cyclobacterium qasimii]EPR66312.1 Transamidase GatB domain protein [Cyclobacterium qasimii M12-11B]GEO21048.1 aspartyl-tRNA amidotransferase subunit B [Cyclobacterium qasimii]
MSLKTNIEKEIKQAMLAKDKDRLRGLRAIKSMIMLEETKGGNENGLSEAEELQILIKAAKQRKDSIEIFEKQDRKDLAEVEATELEVINEFLPKQLSDEELTVELEAIISQTGASGPKDMGKVMGMATKKLAGIADGKAISQKVKALLNP